jgi:hypothetical protein
VSITDDLFNRANARCHRRAYEQWHRVQSKQQILRSQVGFGDTASTKPKPCQGCANYHGLAYGTHRGKRQVLICAIHPYGWQASDHCPDWQAKAD